MCTSGETILDSEETDTLKRPTPLIVGDVAIVAGVRGGAKTDPGHTGRLVWALVCKRHTTIYLAVYLDVWSVHEVGASVRISSLYMYGNASRKSWGDLSICLHQLCTFLFDRDRHSPCSKWYIFSPRRDYDYADEILQHQNTERLVCHRSTSFMSPTGRHCEARGI